MKRAYISIFLAFGLLAALAGPVSAHRAHRVYPSSTTVESPTQAPANGALFGAWVKQPVGTTHNDAVVAFERLVGRSIQIDHHYYSWSKAFPGPQEAWDVAGGRTPIIDWANVGSTKVTSGSVDTTIRARADAVRAFGSPIFLRWAWEMDGAKDLTRTGTPAEFIAAWRHIHDVFAAEGVTNVSWVWCPTAWGFVKGIAQTYYPGDAYVDWVCTDGYNWYPGRSSSKWRTFSQIYKPFYDFGLTTGKPLMVGECGVQEDPKQPGRKAAWIADVQTQLETNFPAIKAYIYFNSDTIYPWWVDSTPGALNAFRALAQDPYFNT